MKLTNTMTMKRKSGMTLLELTVVILVLLSLISILFIGARAWKKGADRAGCIMNIRNVQQAVRGYINMHPELANTPAVGVIYDDTGNLYMKTPLCPAKTSVPYVFKGSVVVDTVAVPGYIFMTCGNIGAESDHVPQNTSAW